MKTLKIPESTVLTDCPCKECVRTKGVDKELFVKEAVKRSHEPCVVECEIWNIWQSQVAQLDHNNKEIGR